MTTQLPPDSSSSHPDSSKIADYLREPPYQYFPDEPEKLKELKFEDKYTASCWCGAVRLAYSTDPLTVKFCHCGDCRVLHGAPFQQAAIFDKSAVRLVEGAHHLDFLSAGDKDKIRDNTHTLSTEPSPCPRKVSCHLCGSKLADEGRKMWMAFPSSFRFDHPGKDKENEKVDGDDNVLKKPKLDSPVMRSIPEAFKVKCHLFYGKRRVNIPDGTPKWEGINDHSRLMTEEA